MDLQHNKNNTLNLKNVDYVLKTLATKFFTSQDDCCSIISLFWQTSAVDGFFLFVLTVQYARIR